MTNRQARKHMTIVLAMLVLLVILLLYSFTGCGRHIPSAETSTHLKEECEQLQEFADSVYGNKASVENADKAIEAIGSFFTPELISEIKSNIYPKIEAAEAKDVNINVSFARVENTIDGADRFLITVERVYAHETEYIALVFKFNQSGVLQWMQIWSEGTPVEGMCENFY
jgi:hypothetical protein